MRALVILLFGLTAVSAAPKYIERIVGGTVTTIQTYPEMASLLFMNRQSCGGTILTHSSILTAAHCVHRDPPARWRSRLGSTNANSGGVIINSARFITHPNYNRITLDSDISIIRLASTISFNNNIRAGRVIASNVNVPDGAVVWAVGWGDTRQGGSPSEQLRHVQIWTINHNVCRQRYASALRVITDNMLCSGWLDVGGRDQCQGDSGGPLFHNRAIAGVSSFGLGCGSPRFPGVNVRVQRFSNWIRQNQ